MFKTIIYTCALLSAAVVATPYKDCGSTSKLKELRVQNCAAYPCKVKRGGDLIVEIDFESNAAVNEIQNSLRGKFNGISAPWPSKLPAACDMLTSGDCPLTVGEAVTYTAVLPISKAFPAISAVAHWELLDDNKKPLICFEVPLVLV